MKVALLGALFGLSTAAQAQDRYYHDYGPGSISVLVGTDSQLTGDPWTARVSLDLEGDIGRGTGAALGFALPAAWVSTAQDRFGVGNASVFEVPPSLRLRFLPETPVRPYFDAGIGAVLITSQTNKSFLFRNRRDQTGWMTRAAFGLEIGSNHGLMLQLVPVTWSTYHLGRDYDRWGAMIGLGGRF